LKRQSGRWKEVRAVSAPTREQRNLLNIDGAAAYLNVPARWVADAVRQRKVRCTRIGKHVRFRVEYLEELVAAGEQPVTTPACPLALVPQPRRAGGRSRL
jgi:excisionase family DNA binding protein